MGEARGRAFHGDTARKGIIPERLLARLWQERAVRAGRLRTAGGSHIRVLYPGRPGTTAGPDFRDALLQVEGRGLVRGDVEVHRSQGDWRAHGHHHDRRYSSVLLHVVYQPGKDADTETALPGGGRCLVLSLRQLEEGPQMAGPSSYVWQVLASQGFPRPGTREAMAALLDQAGDQRLQAKARLYGALLKEQPAAQLLYEALMEGLGYSQNRAPFLELAQRLPYERLRSSTLGLPPAQRERYLTEALLWASGLANAGGYQHPPLWPRPRAGPMLPTQWHLFRVRPVNHPRRRIQGAAIMLSRHLEGGLVNRLLGCLEQGPSSLEGAMRVDPQGHAGPALIGQDRARDLVVNVVLPFALALSQVHTHLKLAQATTTLYHEYKRLQDNEVIREIKRLLLMPEQQDLVTTARRQQGLIYLQRLLAGGAGLGAETPHIL